MPITEPKEIQSMMKQVEAFWMLHPELRFTQLFGMIEFKMKQLSGMDDLYYMNNKKAKSILEKVINGKTV